MEVREQLPGVSQYSPSAVGSKHQTQVVGFDWQGLLVTELSHQLPGVPKLDLRKFCLPFIVGIAHF